MVFLYYNIKFICLYKKLFLYLWIEKIIMIITKQILTLEDFESLKKGDVVACEFKRNIHDYPKTYIFKVFTIFNTIPRTKEVVLQKKNNIYFNYGMFLDPSDGVSNLLSIVLIKQE